MKIQKNEHGYRLVERAGGQEDAFFVVEGQDDGIRTTLQYANLRKPRNQSPEELLKCGMVLDVGSSNITLTCGKCAYQVSPLIYPGGGFGRGVWLCHNGCNAHLKK